MHFNPLLLYLIFLCYPDGSASVNTVGSIDMGGGSIQAAFEIPEEVMYIYSHNFDSVDSIMFLRFRCLTCLHVGLWRLTLAAALKTDSTSIAFTSLPSSGMGPMKYSVST